MTLHSAIVLHEWIIFRTAGLALSYNVSLLACHLSPAFYIAATRYTRVTSPFGNSERRTTGQPSMLSRAEGLVGDVHTPWKKSGCATSRPRYARLSTP